MTAQELFKIWVQEVSTLDISNDKDLLQLFRQVTELNKITQQAEKELNK